MGVSAKADGRKFREIIGGRNSELAGWRLDLFGQLGQIAEKDQTLQRP